MGYETYIQISVIEQGSMTRKEAKKAFNDICEEIDICDEIRSVPDLQTEGNDNNGESFKSLVDASTQYPEMLFEGTIDGTREDSNDQRVFRIKNGKNEVIFMKTAYDPFTQILTKKETEFYTEHPGYNKDLINVLVALRKILADKSNPIHKHQDATARLQRRCVRSALDMVTTAIELKR